MAAWIDRTVEQFRTDIDNTLGDDQQHPSNITNRPSPVDHRPVRTYQGYRPDKINSPAYPPRKIGERAPDGHRLTVAC